MCIRACVSACVCVCVCERELYLFLCPGMRSVKSLSIQSHSEARSVVMHHRELIVYNHTSHELCRYANNHRRPFICDQPKVLSHRPNTTLCGDTALKFSDKWSIEDTLCCT